MSTPQASPEQITASIAEAKTDLFNAWRLLNKVYQELLAATAIAYFPGEDRPASEESARRMIASGGHTLYAQALDLNYKASEIIRAFKSVGLDQQ